MPLRMNGEICVGGVVVECSHATREVQVQYLVGVCGKAYPLSPHNLIIFVTMNSGTGRSARAILGTESNSSDTD
jgi:hypothetical protein